MKILILSKEFRDGEAISEHIKAIAETLVYEKHEVTILSFDDGSYYSIDEKVEVKRAPLNFEGDNIYNWSMILNNELKREATNILQKEKEFDLIHANDWTTIPGGVTLSKHTGKPLILTLHSTENQRGFDGEQSEVISELEYQGVQEAQHILTPNEDAKNSVLFDLSAENSEVTVTDPYNDSWTKKVLKKYQEILKQQETNEKQVKN